MTAIDDQPGDSVTRWLREFESGDNEAAENLWKFYFRNVVSVADHKTRKVPQGAVEAEDIAVSVFESLWRGANEGRFAEVGNRKELWALLLVMIGHKVASHIRKATAQKRGGKAVRKSLNDRNGNGDIADDIVGSANGPDSAVVLREEYERALGLLRTQQLRDIAAMHLAGHTNDEICEAMNIASATVTRKLRLIREAWRCESSE